MSLLKASKPLYPVEQELEVGDVPESEEARDFNNRIEVNPIPSAVALAVLGGYLVTA